MLTVRTDSADWVLPPTRALWIPAGLRHETLSAGLATMRSLYSSGRTGLGPAGWGPVPVTVTPLLAELIGYMNTDSLGAAQRERAEALLGDLLLPVAMTTIDVRMRSDERAAAVAAALLADPADGRTLAERGRNVGASGRTLARAFLAWTATPFGQRRLARSAAAPHCRSSRRASRLAAAARHVGDEVPSAFVAAFRR